MLFLTAIFFSRSPHPSPQSGGGRGGGCLRPLKVVLARPKRQPGTSVKKKKKGRAQTTKTTRTFTPSCSKPNLKAQTSQISRALHAPTEANSPFVCVDGARHTLERGGVNQTAMKIQIPKTVLRACHLCNKQKRTQTEGTERLQNMHLTMHSLEESLAGNPAANGT